MENVIFKGVCTALVTPFAGNAVDYPRLEALVERQIASGVEAVCVCSTTGEGATLTQQEFLNITARTVRQCKGRMKVLAGTGSNDTAEAVSRSISADAMGVDGFLVVTPYYNKATEAGVITHYSAVADAVHCPVVLYNVPSRTGVDISLTAYAELAKHPRICGVKEASGDLGKIACLKSVCGEGFHIWSGNDDQIVPMMAVGADGVVSVLSNLYPAEVCAMANACIAGNYEAAGKLQCRYAELIRALFSEVNPIPIKCAMELIGEGVGVPRLPLTPLCDTARERLDTILQKLSL